MDGSANVCGGKAAGDGQEVATAWSRLGWSGLELCGHPMASIVHIPIFELGAKEL